MYLKKRKRSKVQEEEVLKGYTGSIISDIGLSSVCYHSSEYERLRGQCFVLEIEIVVHRPCISWIYIFIRTI